MSRRVLSIDLETYSNVDLPNCGVYRYVEGDFHILLFAYAFDDEETKCICEQQDMKISLYIAVHTAVREVNIRIGF